MQNQTTHKGHFTMDTYTFIIELHAGETFPQSKTNNIYEIDPTQPKPLPTRWLSLEEFQDEFKIISIEPQSIDDICKQNDSNLIVLKLICTHR